MKLAAIDIGTNAVRLLLKRVIENGNEPIFKKESLVRMPIRLGEDVFTERRISPQKTEDLVKTMRGFRFLMDAYQALDYRACATSAMREAENGPDIVQRIQEEAGIDLQIIDGSQEAEILCSNGAGVVPGNNGSYLFIDVGGGSTETTLLVNNEVVASRSSDIGTIRMLQDKVEPKAWKELRRWLKEITPPHQPLVAIGSGGNINKIFRLARKKEGAPLSYKKIREIYGHVKGFSVKERIKQLRLRPDRADVIIPASEIYISVMKWARIKKMYVPQIGLADGLIHIMYNRIRSGA